MVRSFLLALLALSATHAVAFQASVTETASVHVSGLLDDQRLGSVSPGDIVDVIDCTAKACLIAWPKEIPYGPWVNAAALVVGPRTAAVQAAIARKPSRRGIRTEGDSYMEGAYSAGLSISLADLTYLPVTNTALGGADMASIVDRVALDADSAPMTTVFWDGSHNGLTTVSSYADQQQLAITLLGHDRFVVIPPLHGGDRDAIAAEYASRWPDNYLDWRSVLGDYEGEIPSAWLASPADDFVHLNTASHDAVAAAVLAFIKAKGW